MGKVLTSRKENYAQWYQDLVLKAGLAENSAVRGCMVIKPYGYAIWEKMQAVLDGMFKETGHSNACFPLRIPKSFFSKEASHVEGFAKECAVVTHYRLKNAPDGSGIIVDESAKLEEELIIRPTSETIIWNTYKGWIQSYRDLPILINQWANVMRWEMRTRLFLRTAEFLWQEGHTAHATAEEAMEETARMLNVYATFAEKYLAIPVYTGAKTASERFAGAVETYCIEALMQDGKSLQAGTSHFLGQNFAKAFDVKFAEHELKGVPVRIAIGPRDLENQTVEVARRDTKEKSIYQLTDLALKIEHLLDHIQDNIYKKALNFRDSKTASADTYDEFKRLLDDEGGFILAHWDGTAETEAKIKDETKATIRCIPDNARHEEGKCIISGKPSHRRDLFARAYQFIMDSKRDPRALLFQMLEAKSLLKQHG